MRVYLPLAAVLFACDVPQSPEPATDDHDPTPDPIAFAQPPTDPPAPPPVDGLDWTDCDPDAQCATVEVPLRWEAPGDGAIDLWVKRYPARRSSGQLWLLQGGPGGAAEGLEGYVSAFRAAAPTLDIYLTDHRGVGHSTRLGCGEWTGDAISERCVRAVLREWGDDLSAFTPTAAAYDLGHLVDRVRGSGDRVFVYGVSYGTYWAHRYLQLFPDQADGVVLDSICPPGGCRYALFDERFDAVGREFLERCAGDAFCRGKLGGDPVGRAQSLYRSMKRGGHCPALQRGERTLVDLRRMMAALLASWELRVLVPVVLHRLERCDADDAAFLNWLIPEGISWAPHDRGLDSVVLQYHVLISEMWGMDDAPGEVEALEEATLFATGGPAWMAKLRPVWPAYAPDELAEQWADTATPLLMLNGTLDPQTPLAVADPARRMFDRPFQSFVAIDDAAHGVVSQSPMVDSEYACGLHLVASFLHDPSQLHTRCLRRLRPIDFRGDTIAAELGLDDLWAGGTSPDATGFALRKTSLRPRLKRPVW